MKHAIFDLEGKKIGQYEGELDETSNNRSYLLCPPHAIHLEVPEGMDIDIVKAVLIPEQQIPERVIQEAYEVPAVPAVPGTPAVGEPGDEDYQAEIPEVPEVPAYTVPAVIEEAYTVPAHYEIAVDNNLLAIKIAKEKEEQISVLYNEMVDDVYDNMETLFGTRNDVSAAATASTWEAMAKRPANYVGMNEALSSEAAVLAYANNQLTLADNYAKWRLGRLAQFNAAKAALLA